MSTDSNALFQSFTLGGLTLPNRLVMAPLTRNRATPVGDVPGPDTATYYAQRAGAGLLISEGSQISHQGQGISAPRASIRPSRSPDGAR